MPESWEDKFESLRASRVLSHNVDYLEFLVSKVWRIDRAPVRLAEFGCGYGRFASMLLPLLAAGSLYTGFDSAATLVAKGREIFAESPYAASFVRGEVHHAPLRDRSFDVTIAHLVLMHVPDPELVLREMLRVTRPGGLLNACDANRNGHNALLHIEETDEQETLAVEVFQAVNRSIRRESGVDYNIGMKTPFLMHRMGLEKVQARMSDSIALLIPPVDTAEKEQVFKAMCSEGLGYQPTDEAEIERWRQALVRRGVSPEAADKEIKRELERDFLHKAMNYHTAMACAFTFSFGTVPVAG
jgi:SAM-dependent methyltransferase